MKEIARAALSLLIVAFTTFGRAAAGPGPAPLGQVRVDLTKGDLVVSVMPSLGGRVVGLRAGNGPNLLSWDERWEKDPIPPAALDTPFAAWNGRVIWAGPQSAWWADQELSPERKAAKPPWPPDPFHETARYEVLERTKTRIVMKGAASPINGLESKDTVEIIGPRKIRFVTVATNRRATAVSWDLWPNTRARPEGWPYVQLAPGTLPRIDGPHQSSAGTYPHRVVDGFVALPPGAQPQAPAEHLHAKVFVTPATGEIDYFLNRQLLRLRADLVPQERLHPEQTFVELYRGASSDSPSDILELEMHGAFVRLGPGDSMRFEQTAEILDYDGAASTKEHVAFLKRLLRAVESKPLLR